MNRPTSVPGSLPRQAVPAAIGVVLIGTALAFATGYDYPGVAGVLTLSILSLVYGAIRGLG